MSDTSAQVQNLNLQKNQAFQFAYELWAVAKEEDQWLGGWDPEDFANIVRTYRPELSGNATTLEQAQAQAAKAHEMLQKILGTYSGARGCAKLGRCGVESSSVRCPASQVRIFLGKGSVFFYQNKRVRTEEGSVFCIKPNSLGPKI